jgi:hypothetical protein
VNHLDRLAVEKSPVPTTRVAVPLAHRYSPLLPGYPAVVSAARNSTLPWLTATPWSPMFFSFPRPGKVEFTSAILLIACEVRSVQ